MKQTIYVLGNPLVPSDSLPLKMLDDLRVEFPDIDFRELDPSEELPDERILLFIDTAQGNDDVRILDDIDKIFDEPRYSLHDFGLGTNLKIMRKLNRLDRAIIICVPQIIGYEDALNKVKAKIKELKASLL